MSRTSHTTRPGRRWFAAAAGFALIAGALSGCATGPAEEPDATEAEPTATSVETPETPVVTEDPTEPADTEDPRLPVTVAVVGAEATSAGVEVRSFVTDYVGEGSCRFTLTDSDGGVREWDVAALPDAQSTVCPTTVLDDVAAGTYRLTVTFENEERVGVSAEVSVEVAS